MMYLVVMKITENLNQVQGHNPEPLMNIYKGNSNFVIGGSINLFSELKLTRDPIDSELIYLRQKGLSERIMLIDIPFIYSELINIPILFFSKNEFNQSMQNNWSFWGFNFENSICRDDSTFFHLSSNSLIGPYEVNDIQFPWVELRLFYFGQTEKATDIREFKLGINPNDYLGKREKYPALIPFN